MSKRKPTDQDQAERNEVAKVKVTLKKDHQHGGDIVPAGESIEVRPDQRERLKQFGIV